MQCYSLRVWMIIPHIKIQMLPIYKRGKTLVKGDLVNDAEDYPSKFEEVKGMLTTVHK